MRDQYETTWQDLQREITALSTRGRRIVAEGSGHNIIFEQPAVIIQAVLEMIESVNSKVEVPAATVG